MIDTGVEANVILESQVPNMTRRLTKTHIQLQLSGSKLITPKGEYTVHTHWKTKNANQHGLLLMTMTCWKNPSTWYHAT